MAMHVIVGAGAVGSATALLLAARGEQVRIVTRHGSGPEQPGIERIAADATDAERLTEEGAPARHGVHDGRLAELCHGATCARTGRRGQSRESA